LIPEPGQDHGVHIQFAKKVAQNVAEVLWHRTQRCEFRSDGSLDYYVTVSGLIEISWWILGYGDQAEVKAPAELREIVAKRVAPMAETYHNEIAQLKNGASKAPARFRGRHRIDPGKTIR
jgi:proteasome accessory factor B